MTPLYFPDLLSKKDGHTVRVSGRDNTTLEAHFPGLKADRITKRLIEDHGGELGPWVEAIREAGEAATDQPKKVFTFRPKPAHAPAIENVVAEFARRYPSAPAPALQQVIDGLFLLHARRLGDLAEALAESPLESEAPLKTEHPAEEGPGVRQSPGMQRAESAKPVSCESRDEVIQTGGETLRCGRRYFIWPVVVLILQILLIASLIKLWELTKLALQQSNAQEERLGRLERLVETDGRRRAREMQVLVDAESATQAAVLQLKADFQNLRGEIQTMKSPSGADPKTSRTKP